MTCYDLQTAIKNAAAVSVLELADQQLVSIATIPWQKFTNLTRLNLSKNALKALPKKLLRSPKLRQINLTGNTFSSLPVWLADMPALKHLNVSYNRLRNISSTPRNLEMLNVSNNQIKDISDLPNLSPNLLYLNIAHNPIKTLPENLSKLHQLNIFNAQRCKIRINSMLPPRVQTLNLSNNSIRTLPDNWADLSALKDVDLSHNLLSLHVETFKTTTNLTFLNIVKTKNRIPVLSLLNQNPSLLILQQDTTKKSQEMTRLFFEIQPHKHALHSAAILWQLWQGVLPNNISLTTLQRIWENPVYPIAIRITASHFWQIQSPKFKQNIPITKWGFYLFKEVHEEIQTYLKDNNATPIQQHYIEKNNFFFLPKEDGFKPVDTRTFIRQLDKKNGKQFTFSKNATFIKNMQKLMGGKNYTDKAWLNHLRSQGVPNAVLTDLLYRFLSSRSIEETKRIKQTIFLYLPLPLQLLVRHHHDRSKPLYLPTLKGQSLTAKIIRNIKRATKL